MSDADTLRTQAPEKSEAEPAGQETGEGRGIGRARRLWSQRRVPAVVVSLLLLAATGMLLYDVISVRAGRSAMSWRRSLADRFATTQLDHPAVLAAAALAVVLGIWLLVLAVTPGMRRLLPMRKERARVRAVLERDAAGLVLRDRAMGVSGVRSARIEVRRRKVRARAQAHFRDLDAVRGDLESALADGIRTLGLARRPRLSVRVRRLKKQ